MKRMLLVAVFALCAGAMRADGPADALLDKQVQETESTPKSYDEMVANIERASGLKVKIDPRLETLMKKYSGFWMRMSMEGKPPGVKLRDYLDWQTRLPGLRYEVSGDDHTVTLLPGWQREDERSAADLLKALRRACDALATKTQLDKNGGYNPDWQKASAECGTLIAALASKKENYERGWKMLMTSHFEPGLCASLGIDEPDIVLASDFGGAGTERGFLIVMRYDPVTIPGEGGFGYFYFAPGGLLSSCGIYVAGGDCMLSSASVEEKKGGPEPRLALKICTIMGSDYFTEKFALDNNGLRLEKFVRANGDEVSADALKRADLPAPRSLLEDGVRSH